MNKNFYTVYVVAQNSERWESHVMRVGAYSAADALQVIRVEMDYRVHEKEIISYAVRKLVCGFVFEAVEA